MAVDVFQSIAYVVDAAPEGAPESAQPAPKPLMSIAIFDGTQWASLVPDLDVASCGSSAEEALSAVEEAAADVLALAGKEPGRKPSGPVSDDDLRDFLLAHRGPMGIIGRNFYI
jgi:hypothetical protein